VFSSWHVACDGVRVVLRAKGLLLLVAAAVFGYGTRAEACGAIGCVRSTDVLPADGSAGVPINAEIRMRSFYCDTDLDAARLQAESGVAIALSGDLHTHPGSDDTWFIAQPSEPLAPSMRYEIQRRFDPTNDGAVADADDEWVTISTFETGADADLDAPKFSGITGLKYGTTVDHWAGCGSRDVIELEPSFEPASDTSSVSGGVTTLGSASPALRYNVYVDGVLAVPYYMDLLHDPFGEMFVDCNAQALQVGPLIATASTIEVRAVDLAGNESPPHVPLALDLDCTFAETTTPVVDDGDVVPLPLDEGEATAEPAVSADGAPTPSISRGPGCTIPLRTPSARSPTLWPLLALLLPALRRLRRRDPTPGRSGPLK
jgi:hypothetical protein